MEAQAAKENYACYEILLNKYIFEKDRRVVLQDITAPPKECKNLEDVFEFAYKHEQEVTEE